MRRLAPSAFAAALCCASTPSCLVGYEDASVADVALVAGTTTTLPITVGFTDDALASPIVEYDPVLSVFVRAAAPDGADAASLTGTVARRGSDVVLVELAPREAGSLWLHPSRDVDVLRDCAVVAACTVELVVALTYDDPAGPGDARADVSVELRTRVVDEGALVVAIGDAVVEQ